MDAPRSSIQMESYYRKEDGARKSLTKEKDFLGCVRVKLLQSCPTLWYPKACKPARLLCPWDFPGKSIGVGGHFLPKGISPAQELSPRLLHLLQLAGRFFTTMPPGKPCSSLGRRGWHELYGADRLFFPGGMEGPQGQLPHWEQTRKFQTGWLRFHFW